MTILVGCEESQEVCKAFRAKGHEAYSCDLQECSGGHPEWHLQMDVKVAIKLKKWDLAIFFPDCTFLTSSAEWCYKEQPALKSGKLVGKERQIARKAAIHFFMYLWSCGIKKVAIENPIGVMSSFFRKPDQIIQPWQFGHPESKATCLWVKGLSILQPTKIADFKKYRCKCGNTFEVEAGKYGCCPDYAAKPMWDNQTKSGQNKLPPSADRAKLRSKTFPGIAAAMADQWG